MANQIQKYTSEEINKTLAQFIGLPFDGIQYNNSFDVISYFPELCYTRYPKEMEFHLNLEWLERVQTKLMETGIITEISFSRKIVGINDISSNKFTNIFKINLSDKSTIAGTFESGKRAQEMANTFTYIILSRKLLENEA